MINEAESTKSFRINFNHDVTPHNLGELEAFIKRKVLEEGKNNLLLCISSNGGNISCVLSFFDMIKDLPLKITTVNYNMIASSANILFLVGDERYAFEDSSFFFHEPFVNFAWARAATATIADFEQYADLLRRYKEKMANIFQKITGCEREDAEKLYSGSFSFSSKRALELRLIDGVIDRSSPALKIQIGDDYHILSNTDRFLPFESVY